MVEYTKEQLQDDPSLIAEVKFVRIVGYFRISSEIDRFEAYIVFQGLDFDYHAVADVALQLYFIELDVYQVEDDDHPWSVTFLDRTATADWAASWLDRPEIVYDKNEYILLDMTQITEKVSKRGFRRSSRKWVNRISGEYGTVTGFYGIENEIR